MGKEERKKGKKKKRKKTVSNRMYALTGNINLAHDLPGAGLKFLSVLTTVLLPKNRIYKVHSCQDRSPVILWPPASKDLPSPSSGDTSKTLGCKA